MKRYEYVRVTNVHPTSASTQFSPHEYFRDIKLTISARDTQGSGTMESTAKAIITVLRVNRHKPEFVIPALSNATIEIPGDIVQPDYLLLTVRAMDNDTEENGKISYHLQVNNRNEQQTGEFKIDEVTGELRARTQLNRKNRAK